MRATFTCICIALAFLVLSGCWSRRELSEWGFVQAAAIDRDPDGTYHLTVHIYKPAGTAQGTTQKSDTSYIDIHAHNATLFGASRNVATKLGRRLQWSHIRVLLISEELAKSTNIMGLLDFFQRNHEMRGNIDLMVTQGSASDYLKLKPYIENTLGQQLLEISKTTFEFTGRTVESSLTDLIIKSKEEVPLIVIPYIRMQKQPEKEISINGLAVFAFPQGTQINRIPSRNTPSVLMLMNTFKKGTLNIPCSIANGLKAADNNDSFEITRQNTRIQPLIKGNNLSLEIHTSIEGIIGELSCSSVATTEEVTAYTHRIEKILEEQLKETLILLQKENIDLIGVGKHLYRYHNRIWKMWKPDWPHRFSESEYRIDVNVTLMNSGTVTGKIK